LSGRASSRTAVHSLDSVSDPPVGYGVDRSGESRLFPTDSERLLSVAEVADLLAVPVTWVREATRTKRLPHVRLGRYVRYERAEIMAWLSEQRSGRARGSAFGSKGMARR
jgi:excisionase family DNA binding protein